MGFINEAAFIPCCFLPTNFNTEGGGLAREVRSVVK